MALLLFLLLLCYIIPLLIYLITFCVITLGDKAVRRVSASPIQDAESEGEGSHVSEGRQGQGGDENVNPPNAAVDVDEDVAPAPLNMEEVVDDVAAPADAANRFHHDVTLIAPTRQGTTPEIINSLTNEDVQVDIVNETIRYNGHEYKKVARPSWAKGTLYRCISSTRRCKADLIVLDEMDPAFSELTGLTSGMILKRPHDCDNYHGLHGRNAVLRHPADAPTMFRLPVSAVFPNFFDENGNINLDVNSLKIVPDLVRILQTRSGGNAHLTFGLDLFDTEEYTSFVQSYIKCFEGGFLSGISDDISLSREMYCDVMNTYDTVPRRSIDTVMNKSEFYDVSRFLGRQPSPAEPSNYSHDLHTRGILNLHFHQEVILKKFHNVIISDGVIESNRGVRLRDLDYNDGAYDARPPEVVDLLQSIRAIPQEEVVQNPKDLSDVLNVGAHVQRTIRLGEQFNDIELQIGMAICVLSQLRMLPEHPNEEGIDWTIDYFGRRYNPPESKNYKFDGLYLFAMMTGRKHDHNGASSINYWSNRRGMKIRSRKIVQENVSADDSTRLCIFLERLAIQLRDHVNQAAEGEDSE